MINSSLLEPSRVTFSTTTYTINNTLTQASQLRSQLPCILQSASNLMIIPHHHSRKRLPNPTNAPYHRVTFQEVKISRIENFLIKKKNFMDIFLRSQLMNSFEVASYAEKFMKLCTLKNVALYTQLANKYFRIAQDLYPRNFLHSHVASQLASYLKCEQYVHSYYYLEALLYVPCSFLRDVTYVMICSSYIHSHIYSYSQLAMHSYPC